MTDSDGNDRMVFEASVEGMQRLLKHFDERLIRAECRSSIMTSVISLIVMELRAKQLIGQALINCLDKVEQQYKSRGIPFIDEEVEMTMTGLRHAMGLAPPSEKRANFTVIDGGGS
jgi:hypothetical protein